MSLCTAEHTVPVGTRSARALTSAPRATLAHDSGSWQWWLLAGWLCVDVAARVVLGPALGNSVIGVLGVLGVLAFCDWWRPQQRP